MKDPLEVTQQENKDIQLACTVSAGSPKPLAFQWFFKPETGAEIAVTDRLRAMKTAFYNITKLTYKSAGVYRCEVDNGHDEKDEYQLTLNVLRKFNVIVIFLFCFLICIYNKKKMLYFNPQFLVKIHN